MNLDFIFYAVFVIFALLALHVVLGLFPLFLHNEKLQIRRKFQHISTGLLLVSLDPVFTRIEASLLLWFGVLVIYAFHKYRLAHPTVNIHFQRICGPYLRPHELHSLPGAFYFFLGCALTVTLFIRKIAVLAVLYLSVGDPLASLVGICYGKYGPRFSNGKSLVGMMAMILCCSFITLIYMRKMESTLALLAWAIIGPTAAGVAESIPFFKPHLDDNLRVPVVSAVAMWVVWKVQVM